MSSYHNVTLKHRKRQLEAINKSIEGKWQPICNGAPILRGDETNCSCCREFLYGPENCYGCPIAEFTGQTLCSGLPPFIKRNAIEAVSVKNHPNDVAVLNKLKEIQQWLEWEIATSE